MTGDCCAFKFLRLRVDGKHLMRFQSKNTVFKFLLQSVDGKHLLRLSYCLKSDP